MSKAGSSLEPTRNSVPINTLCADHWADLCRCRVGTELGVWSQCGSVAGSESVSVGGATRSFW